MIVIVELLETVRYERCLIYPVRFTSIFRQEDNIIIEVDSLEDLKMISEGFQKPLLYDDHHYIVIFDKEVHYRTKKPDM